jgi:phosphoglycolate phosphatase-like HAD superfamily hydrolase
MDQLVLFDIDGTLLLSHGAGIVAMEKTGRRVVGRDFELSTIEFAGRLDPQIWADAARSVGVDPDADGELHARFREEYGRTLKRVLRGRPAYALPGVKELVGRLRVRENTTIGLVTGNYPETGQAKIASTGIDPDAFAVAAWGTDGAIRRELPPVAMAAYAKRTGHAIEPGQVVVIGDTVHDVDCAHHNGCLAIAVATGPAFDLEALREAGPDLLLEDLTDTEGILTWLNDARA